MERISGSGQFLKTVSISCPRQRSMMERQQKWQVHTLLGYQNHRIIFPTENLLKPKVLVTASP